MQIAHEIGERHEVMLDVIGDLLRGRSIGIAGEQPIEVAIVDRRGAPPGHRGGEVGGWQNDDAALDARGVQRLRQIAERDLAFVFVAMRAGDEQRRRAVTILQHYDGNRNETIGGAVH